MRVLLTGGSGLLGSALIRSWTEHRPGDELIAPPRGECNLHSSEEINSLLTAQRPDLIIHAAAEVSGIQDRIDQPTRFLLSNILIDSNLINGALRAEVPSLITIGSSTMYPAEINKPILENALLTGPFGNESEGYGLAKAMSAKLVEYISHEFGLNYRSLVPSNIYGCESPKNGVASHLISAALEKVQTAIAAGSEVVTIWGDGKSRREMLFADDLASWVANSIDDISGWPPVMNVGFGEDYSIQQYYEWAAEAAGYFGSFDFDENMPNGVRERLLDSSVARTHGWAPITTPLNGMKQILRSREEATHD